MFKQRVITAIALVLGLVALLFNLNPLNFSLIVAPIVLLAGWEWSNLMGLESKRHRFAYILLLALAIAIAAVSLDLFGTLNISLGQTLCLIASILWAVVFLWVQGYPSSAILWSPRPILGLLGHSAADDHLGCYCADYSPAPRSLVIALCLCGGGFSRCWWLCGGQFIRQAQVGATGQSGKNLGRLLWRHPLAVHFDRLYGVVYARKNHHCYVGCAGYSSVALFCSWGSL